MYDDVKQPTQTTDYHFFLVHSYKVKTRFVIDFMFRVLRVCNQEYIDEEFRFINEEIMKVAYPRGLLMRLRNKAISIKDCMSFRQNPVPRNNNVIFTCSKF